MYNLIPMTMDHLDLVLEWRNQPEIRKNMYTSHQISREEHYAWFERVKEDPSKRYLICSFNGEPVGVVNFVEINHTHKTASWGFYSGDTTKRGVGTQMEFLALNYAFEELGLEKLNCEVLSFNYPVVSFHRKFGFRIEGIFKRHHFDGERYVDIYRLAMFRRDWLEHLQSKFRKKLEGDKSKDRFEVGASYSEVLSLTREQIAKFADVTGDDNPVHLNDADAQAAGFPSVICHGFLVGACFSRIFGTKFPGSGTIYVGQTMTFKKPVFPDQPLTVTVKIVSRIGKRAFFETTVHNENNEILLEGEAELIVPSEV